MMVARIHSARRASSSLLLSSPLTKYSCNRNSFDKLEYAIRLSSRCSTIIVIPLALSRTCRLQLASKVEPVTSIWCTKTGETFSSGTLYSVIDDEEKIIQRERAHFFKKETAIHAPVARDIDCFAFRGGNVEDNYRYHRADQTEDLSVTRLCAERPYSLRENSAISSSDKNDDNADRLFEYKNVESPKVSTKSENNRVSDKHEFVSAIKDEKRVEEKEFIIQHVPGPCTYNSCLNVASSQRTTIDRILEAWVEAPLSAAAGTFSNSTVLSSFEREGGAHTDALLAATTAAISRCFFPCSVRHQSEAIIACALACCRRMEHDFDSNSLSSEDEQLCEGEWHRIPRVMLTGSNQSLVSVHTCNAILNALANVNNTMHNSSCYYFDQSSVKEQSGGVKTLNGASSSLDVEVVAKQLLDKMTQRPTTSNTTSLPSSQLLLRNPNTDTYNAFIRCIRRSTPLETAVAAEQILNDMLYGDDKLKTDNGKPRLPPPTVETFNTVMDLWSCALSRNYRDTKMKELYSKLEELTNDRDNSFRPNRGTFLAALTNKAVTPVSSGTCENTFTSRDLSQCRSFGFNTDEAQSWIDRMEALAEQIGDNNALRVDTEIYNAPLPWSGRKNSKSLPLAVTSPWDDYESIFSNGFQPLPSHNKTIANLVLDATKIENWLHKMERLDTERNRRKSVAPNIETYESVIQAWVRTGTVEGVLRAELWAMKAIAAASSLDLNVKPRLQTFHPIIAAWAHCGDTRGPGKVREWIERLEKLSLSIPEVEPDGRIRAAIILAWRKCQIGLEKAETTNIDRNFVNDAHHSQVVLQVDSKCNNPQRTKLQRNIANEKTLATFNLSMSAAKNCTDCLEHICTKLREQRTNNEPTPLALDGSAFEHVVNAWGDVAALARKDTAAFNGESEIQMHHALSEMMRSIQILNDLIDFYRDWERGSTHTKREEKTINDADDASGELEFDSANDKTRTYEVENDKQLCHLMYASHKIHSTAVSHFSKIDTLSIDKGSQRGPMNLVFPSYFPYIEKMLRRSVEYARTLCPSKTQFIATKETRSFEYDSANRKELFLQAGNTSLTEYHDYELNYHDMYSYEPYRSSDYAKNDSAEEMNFTRLIALFTVVLQGSKSLSSSSDYGDAVRVLMCVLECTAEIQDYYDQKMLSYNPPLQTSKQVTEIDTSELTNIHLDLIYTVGDVVPNLAQRKILLERIYNQVMRFRSKYRNMNCIDEKGKFLDAMRKCIPEDNANVDAFLNKILLSIKRNGRKKKPSEERYY